ncbi:MAG: hypothetical protein DRG39_00600 [Deltaproteobacteria bacterium]|nr:MAG: hypothetical protein DRG39_00600 [Deltaproteobacteria bacterium]
MAKPIFIPNKSLISLKNKAYFLYYKAEKPPCPYSHLLLSICDIWYKIEIFAKVNYKLKTKMIAEIRQV